MASIVIMFGGAVLNATAFIGGNYLARALGRGDKAALEEKSATTKLSKIIKQLTPNTHATEHNFSTGSRPTPKKRSRPSRTSPTPTMPSNSTTRHILTKRWYPPKSPSSQISISQATSRKRVNSCS